MSKQKEYYLPEWYKYGARGFQQRINNARNQLDSLLKFFDDEYNFLWSESCRYWSANDAWDRYTPVVIKKYQLIYNKVLA